MSYEKENFLLKSIYPNNCIIEDENGAASVMVRIPKMTLKDLGLADSDELHPAFIVNGKEVDEIYFSKYPNAVIDGNAVSVPDADPASAIRLDEAYELCARKGKGWHMMTRAEFALLAQICVKNGFLPWGNNMNGKDYRECICTARRSNETGHTATGTGPASWYHDNTFAGIADLNGNTSDWVSGVRLYYGEIQVMPENNAADTANAYEDDDKWMAINGKTGEFIKPVGEGETPDSVKLDFNDRDAASTCAIGWRWITGTPVNKIDKKRGDEYSNTYCDDTICEKAKIILRSLALLPADSNPNTYEHGKFFANNGGKNLTCHAGANYHDKADAGMFFVRFCDEMPHATDGIGFRASYIDLK